MTKTPSVCSENIPESIGVNDLLLLAKLLIQHRAPARAQHVAEELQRRRVRMSQPGNAPSQRKTRQFRGKFFVRIAAADLLRFACNINRLQGWRG